jgi:hypothetical protein
MKSRTPAVMVAGGIATLTLIVLGATRGPASADAHAGTKAPALAAHVQPR